MFVNKTDFEILQKIQEWALIFIHSVSDKRLPLIKSNDISIRLITIMINMIPCRWPVNSSYKRPVTRKMFPLYDVIMLRLRTSQTMKYFNIYFVPLSSMFLVTCTSPIYIDAWCFLCMLFITYATFYVLRLVYDILCVVFMSYSRILPCVSFI